jgi:monoterpene epsilon-lactone hydrolase
MSLPLNANQAATISAEASAFLRAQPAFRLPRMLYPLVTSPARIPRFRAQFQSGEDIVEEKLVRDHGLRLEPTTIAGVPVLIVHPRQLADGLENAIVFNVHGGGFVMGTARERTALLTAAEMGIRVYSVDYALAPEARYPVAIEQCLAVYRALIEELSTDAIVATSSSAGGQILLTVINRALREGLHMPAALGLFTPAADISGNGDSPRFNNGRDLQPTELAMQMMRRSYLVDADPMDPDVSPLYAHYTTATPPTIITSGTRDMLMSNAVRLYWKLREADVETELLISEGMWHGFNWEPDVPEAIRARRIVQAFLRSHLLSAAKRCGEEVQA